jgi:hypothetical protein
VKTVSSENVPLRTGSAQWVQRRMLEESECKKRAPSQSGAVVSPASAIPLHCSAAVVVVFFLELCIPLL